MGLEFSVAIVGDCGDWGGVIGGSGAKTWVLNKTKYRTKVYAYIVSYRLAWMTVKRSFQAMVSVVRHWTNLSL